ncbi:hypothetical protein HYT05_02130 [Candidatus Kaiserbacteria bacterium]|nr:hypothetical protein [Candidatus Kaiserbacteria bacterium]
MIDIIGFILNAIAELIWHTTLTPEQRVRWGPPVAFGIVAILALIAFGLIWWF